MRGLPTAWLDKKPVQCIVLGASAGGVEAINRFLQSLTQPLPIPLIITLHIAKHATFFEHAFRGKIPITVKEAEDKEHWEAGVVYLAPPDYHLLLETDGQFSLSSEEPVCYARPSIDVMFESATYSFGNRAMGILLTGANEDGAKGLFKIHQSGGFCLVQDPREAQCATMPESALKLFSPSHIFSVEEMGRFLSQRLSTLPPMGVEC
ncbi:MAG: chemotaxis protein CheB [Proteobacteria bacterium]|nr:MAG: chemotaxis protein CheB [Pseudomonadota bacterium]